LQESGVNKLAFLRLSVALCVAMPAGLCTAASSDAPVRARALGIPFDGTPGTYNAITDVKGVEVGYTTLIQSDGPHAVRTGVTAILPRGTRNRGPAGVRRRLQSQRQW
jgi:hypothetical protein